MKILMISNMYPSDQQPSFGVFVENWEKGMIRNGGNVQKVVIYGRGNSTFQKIMKYRKFLFDAIKNLLFSKYDLIYIHYIGHSLLPVIMIWPLVHKPLVLNAHGDDVLPSTWIQKFIYLLTHHFVKKSDLIVVPSNYYKMLVQERYKHDHIFVSPSAGIDLALFQPLPHSQRISNRQKVLHLGFVSRIDTGKGWDIFLKSISRILKKYPEIPVQAVIVGSGKEVIKMQQMISEMKLENNVNYLGLKSHDELAKIYPDFDVFVFSTRLPESLGLVGIEAMACGVPVIGSDIGGIASYIQTGVNGYLFPAGDVDELANKIATYYRLPSKVKQLMSEQALKTAQNYANDSVSKELYIKLNHLIKCKNCP